MSSQIDPPSTGQNFEFIVILRAVAALMVVYSHLIGPFGGRALVPFSTLIGFIKGYISTPLAFINDTGALGVCIFFLISGFIITHTAQRENRPTFAIKRALRIYPPFFLSIALIFVVAGLTANNPYAAPMNHNPPFTPLQTLLSLPMLNYLFTNVYEVNPVAWTLLIEVLFYVICVLTLPLIKARSRLAVLVNLGCCALIIASSQRLGITVVHLSFFLMFVPYLVVGQAIYYLWSGRIDWRSFGALAILCYVVNLYGLQSINRTFYVVTNSYPISMIYALAIFGGALILTDRLKPSRVVRFFSTISYSLYLNHRMIGTLILLLLMPRIGYTFALPFALAGGIGVAYLSWRFVEKPSQGAARELIRRLKLAPVKPDRNTGGQTESAPTAGEPGGFAPTESASG